jgi:undecaprenyl-diphosphatase
LIEIIKKIDTEVFLLLNSLHSPASDFIMWWLSDKLIWIPLYAFVLFVLIKKHKIQSIKIIVFFLILAGITDLVSVHLFKNVFLRYRPCHNIEIQDYVHIVNNYCGGLYGFISSHATNVFGFATLSSYFIKNKKFTITIFVWATLVSYSRIALGVHYPLDIIFGAFIGIMSGIILVKIYNLKLHNKNSI